MSIRDKNSITAVFQKIYGDDDGAIEKQKERYEKLLTSFSSHFGDKKTRLFSTPGRTEIGGNHTDHNHGRVLAGSVDLDSIAAAAVSTHKKVTLYSDGYPEPFVADLAELSPREDERGSTTALIRGIAARFAELGYEIGGFNACLSSDVLPGSGLSSSASIEVLIGTIFNHLFNDGRISAEQLAIVGQYSENEYFGKPCGLMDQMACAIGGIITIDFKDPQHPIHQKVAVDFSASGYQLAVVNTGGNHADLTPDYAAIPAEMKKIAHAMGVSVCAKISLPAFITAIPDLRTSCGDRAVLRVWHFLHETDRVPEQVKALESHQFDYFLELIKASGNSSFRWLQNVFTTHNPAEQGVSLALALCENYLAEINAGACRVHGGGFAGTIQVFLPTEKFSGLQEILEPIFGIGSVLKLNIRPIGTMEITQN